MKSALRFSGRNGSENSTEVPSGIQGIDPFGIVIFPTGSGDAKPYVTIHFSLPILCINTLRDRTVCERLQTECSEALLGSGMSCVGGSLPIRAIPPLRSLGSSSRTCHRKPIIRRAQIRAFGDAPRSLNKHSKRPRTPQCQSRSTLLPRRVSHLLRYLSMPAYLFPRLNSVIPHKSGATSDQGPIQSIRY